MNCSAKTITHMALLVVGLMGVAPAGRAESTNSVDSDREPPGSRTLTYIDHTNNTVVYSNSVSHSNWTLKINSPPPPITYPYSYKDPNTGIVFYVESDGHHVAALDQNGKILWCRQPALDGNLPPYSETRPQPNPLIIWIGALTKSQSDRLKTKGSGKFVGVAFRSRQAGVLDVTNGDLTFQGQN